jgi:hypothetical protein
MKNIWNFEMRKSGFLFLHDFVQRNTKDGSRRLGSERWTLRRRKLKESDRS